MGNKDIGKFNRTLGKRLKSFRTGAGVTQGEIAKAAGCSMNHISLIERGKCRASVYVLIAYADTLDLSLDTLTGHDGRLKEICESAEQIMKDSEKILTLAGRDQSRLP